MELGGKLGQEWKKRHKRKQTRPRSICEVKDGDEAVNVKLKDNSITEGHVDDDLESQEDTNDEAIDALDKDNSIKQFNLQSKGPKQIKQKPLCSKLCIKKERRVQKSPIRKEPSLSSEEITDIINATNENTTSPCTTNRYRRHFLKQLRKAEARRSKENLEKESDTELTVETESIKDSDKEEQVTVNDETEIEEDNVIEGKKIKLDKSRKRDGYECKVCQKKFHTTGLFMAHYICHSSFEKEHASLVTETTDEDKSKTKPETEDNSKTKPETDDKSKTKPETGSTSTASTENKPTSSSDYLEDSTYFCHVCNKRFNNINALQIHMESHPDEKDACSDGKREHYCNLCHKKFASAGSLHVHNKIHTGDNPYTCLKCNKSFRDKTRLTTHIRVHTGKYSHRQHITSARYLQDAKLTS